MTPLWWEGFQTALLLVVTGGLIGLTFIGMSLSERLGSGPGRANTLERGEEAPKIMMPDVRTGALVSLAELVEGIRFTVVVFLSPTCRACIGDIPVLNDLAERLKDVRFVAVIEAGDGFDFAADLSHTMNVVMDRDGALQTAFGVRLFPHASIIDAEGRIAVPATADVRNIARLTRETRDSADQAGEGFERADGEGSANDSKSGRAEEPDAESSS